MADNNRSRREHSIKVVYQQKSAGVQIMVFIGVLMSIPVIGWFVSNLLGTLSTNAQTAIYISFFLILLFGYGLWFVRLGVRAISAIGKNVLFAIFRLGKQKKEQKGQEERLPIAEGHDQFDIALQQTASSFFIVSILMGVVSGLSAIFYESATEAWLRVCIVFGACLLWGLFLANLAKRGYLPIPSDEE